MKMWPANLLARLHQDENAFLLSTLLHIKEFSRLRHSSIADKENYIFPTSPWPCHMSICIKVHFTFYEDLRDMNREE